jgi:hypothetical protein
VALNQRENNVETFECAILIPYTEFHMEDTSLALVVSEHCMALYTEAS